MPAHALLLCKITRGHGALKRAIDGGAFIAAECVGLCHSPARPGDRVANGSACLLNGSDGFALVGIEASVEPVAHDTWGAHSVGELASTMHAWPLQFCGVAATTTTRKKEDHCSERLQNDGDESLVGDEGVQC